MKDRILNIALILLLIPIGYLGVQVHGSVLAVPSDGVANPAQGESVLAQEYDAKTSAVVAALREADLKWQDDCVAAVHKITTAGDPVDTGSEELEQARNELLVLQAVMDAVKKVSEQFAQSESVGAEQPVSTVVDQMIALADALYMLGIVEFEEDAFVVVENIDNIAVERAMTDEERAAVILGRMSSLGYIQFDERAFWQAVNAQNTAGSQPSQNTIPPAGAQDPSGDGSTQPPSDGEEQPTSPNPAPEKEEVPTPEGNYHGQFKAQFVCTCGNCFDGSSWPGVEMGENKVWADTSYITAGSIVTLDEVPDKKFTVYSGGEYTSGRNIVVFCSNHSVSSIAKTRYPKVYLCE